MPKPLPSQALEHIPDHVLDKHPELHLLAVAFTDQNRNHKYEPGKDLLIASLLDTNRDGSASVGDTIHWGTYPTTFDVNGPRGTFRSLDTLVTFVLPGDHLVEVQTEDPLGSVLWEDLPFLGERFVITGSTILQDALPRVAEINVTPSAPGITVGAPDTPVDIRTFLERNDGFLDVLLFV
jgi:hypothetical protein